MGEVSVAQFGLGIRVRLSFWVNWSLGTIAVNLGDMLNQTPSIQSLTASVCALMGVAWPEHLSPALEPVLAAAQMHLGGRTVSRCLVYAPDALGHHLYRRDPRMFAAIEAACPERVALRAVMPSVTPVCFASIFTGLSPDQHGIREYAKPVLTCDTLFDLLARAGKRVAIVAVANSSIDTIFRERNIDYYSENYDAEATERALELLAKDQHDFILVYHQEYDDMLHDHTPFDPVALAAAERNVSACATLAAAAREAWRHHDIALIVAPDHGAHIDPATGKGDHGLDIPEDMEVNHFYGLWPRSKFEV